MLKAPHLGAAKLELTEKVLEAEIKRYTAKQFINDRQCFIVRTA